MHRAPIIIAQSLAVAIGSVDVAAEPIVVLPSSLSADDRLARGIATMLTSDRGVHAEVAGTSLRGGVRALLARPDDGWRSIDVRERDLSCELERVVLPATLADAGSVLVACELDDVAARGPYVLDVAASYVAPATRLRLHASRSRVAVAAEVDLALCLGGAILALTVGGERWFVATRDPVAGELAALALSERARGAGTSRSVVGPWEDPLVQRATELRLGVLLPANLDLVLVGAGEPGAEAGAAIARHLALRLGIP